MNRVVIFCCALLVWSTACSDDDSECPSQAPSCISDYCWGWEYRQEAALGCLNMNTDYSAGPELGTIAVRIYGRPGAVWTKQNRFESCGLQPTKSVQFPLVFFDIPRFLNRLEEFADLGRHIPVDGRDPDGCVMTVWRVVVVLGTLECLE